MAAYIVAHLSVHDAEAFDAYRRQTPEVIAEFGGRYLVRGGAVEPLEGDWPVERLVIIEFPDKARARAFYDSDAYQALVPLRQAGASGTLALVEGVT